jgi:UPF0755 protein
MKKIAFLPMVIIILVISFAAWIFLNTRPTASVAKYIDFSVTSGETAAQIGTSLYKKGIIKNQTLFKICVQFMGLSSSIQAGNYRLSSGMDLFKVVSVLSKKPQEIKVTIPEGFTYTEIAARFTKNLDRDQDFNSEFLQEAKKHEGYLFPDTYSVANNASPSAIIAKMRNNFNVKTSGMNLTYDQVVLASIIEKETKSIEERPVVAGILMNRLESGMPLQVDVARITYMEKGLPAAPIANPGLVSIKAVINPSKTDYWYYLHDSSGKIHYAKTLAEQNENIKNYLRD